MLMGLEIGLISKGMVSSLLWLSNGEFQRYVRPFECNPFFYLPQNDKSLAHPSILGNGKLLLMYSSTAVRTSACLVKWYMFYFFIELLNFVELTLKIETMPCLIDIIDLHNLLGNLYIYSSLLHAITQSE